MVGLEIWWLLPLVPDLCRAGGRSRLACRCGNLVTQNIMCFLKAKQCGKTHSIGILFGHPKGSPTMAAFWNDFPELHRSSTRFCWDLMDHFSGRLPISLFEGGEASIFSAAVRETPRWTSKKLTSEYEACRNTYNIYITTICCSRWWLFPNVYIGWLYSSPFLPFGS